MALSLLITGVASRDLAAEVIRGGSPACPGIALTFDLCPVRDDVGYDEPLVEFLKDKHIPATFFVSGRWALKHDPEVRSLLAVPFFEVGTHGQVHAHLPLLDEDGQRSEIERAVSLFHTRYGHRANLFRPPYGEFNDTTVSITDALGLKLIMWNVESGDPDPLLSKDRILSVIIPRIRPGSLLVFHANGKGKHTREVIEDLYERLFRPHAVTPVTVTELLSCRP
jgi:peptidoglycan/xylan/chitin deacetylase (PgdA/CDA1 family)